MRRREAVIRSVVEQIVHNANAQVTIEGLKEFLKIPEDGARRIIENLVSAGILCEMPSGVWTRVLKFPSPRRPLGSSPRKT